MLLLNIFQHSDGTFAWDIILIILLAAIAGYLLHRFTAKKTENKNHNLAITEWENKYKRLESEYKNYKSNIAATEKHNEKAVIELNSRAKALEGDIRALADEKNKFHNQLMTKDEEIKRYSRQVSNLEDNLKALQETKAKAEADWSAKLKSSNEALIKASSWEAKVKGAEEESQKAKAAIGNAERKKLEAELRLKATVEYAGKVGPLEIELNALKEKYAMLETEIDSKIAGAAELETKLKKAEDQLIGITEENLRLKNDLPGKEALINDLQVKLQSTEKATSAQNIMAAELELMKQNNAILQQEIEAKHASRISLVAEIESLKTGLKRLADENETLRTASKIQANNDADNNSEMVIVDSKQDELPIKSVGPQ